MKYINLCPHNIMFDVGHKIKVSCSGHVVRANTITTRCSNGEIPLEYLVDESIKSTFPPPKEGVIYIVSSRVERLLPERYDVFFPAGFSRDPLTRQPEYATVLRKHI
jgi:hypothetical protein